MEICKVLFTVLVFAAAFSFRQAQGTKCFECNDDTPLDNTNGPKKCPSVIWDLNLEALKTLMGVVDCDSGCLKDTVHHAGSGSSIQVSVSRGCAAPGVILGCTNITENQVNINRCICDSAFCNSGIALVPMGTTKMGAVLVFTMSLFVFGTL